MILTDAMIANGWTMDEDGDIRYDDIDNRKQWLISEFKDELNISKYELCYGCKFTGFKLQESFRNLDDAICRATVG